MAIYLNNRQMLSKTGYQECDVYLSQQLSLESQIFRLDVCQEHMSNNDICHLQQMRRGNRF